MPVHLTSNIRNFANFTNLNKSCHTNISKNICFEGKKKSIFVLRVIKNIPLKVKQIFWTLPNSLGHFIFSSPLFLIVYSLLSDARNLPYSSFSVISILIHRERISFVPCRNRGRSPRQSRNYRVSGKHGNRTDSVRDSNKVSSLQAAVWTVSNPRVCGAENFHPPALSCQDSRCPSENCQADCVGCVMRRSPGRKTIICTKGNRVKKMKLAGDSENPFNSGANQGVRLFCVTLLVNFIAIVATITPF